MSALPILDLTENSFKIRTSNFNSVLSIVGDRPFAIISINGATRTGKSHALNYFLRFLASKNRNENSLSSAESRINLVNAPRFKAKSGRTRTTLGIDLWSEPFIINVDGREVAVLFMDCQGLFDDETTAKQNAIIFCLSSLCSSMSIFNLMRNIDESMLQQIHFFSGYAHLVYQEDESEPSEENAFQRLTFLLRDFEFPDYEYGYHGNCKKPKRGRSFYDDVFDLSAKTNRPPENRFVREEILNSYSDVSCFLMPHPGRQFTRDENQPTDEDFEEYMKELVKHLLSPENLATKKIGGQEITGNQFKKFIEGWATLCENEANRFPTVQTVAETTAIIQNTLALDTATAHYETAMSSFLNCNTGRLSEKDFLKRHEQLQLEAVELFDAIKKLGGESMIKQYRQSLTKLITKMFERSRQSLLSKVKTDKELLKNKQILSEFQQKLHFFEEQTKRDKDQKDKVIDDMQRKMPADKKSIAEHLDKLKLSQNNYTQLNPKAKSEIKVLIGEIERSEQHLQQCERRNKADLEKLRREMRALVYADKKKKRQCVLA